MVIPVVNTVHRLPSFAEAQGGHSGAKLADARRRQQQGARPPGVLLYTRGGAHGRFTSLAPPNAAALGLDPRTVTGRSSIDEPHEQVCVAGARACALCVPR